MFKLISKAFLFGCALGVLLFAFAGCAGTFTTFKSTLGLEEPVINDSIIKFGPSYGYDVRQVTVTNPMEQTIAVAVDCRYKDPVELTIEPHSGVKFTMPASKSLESDNQCELAWEIAGQGAPIVSRFRPH